MTGVLNKKIQELSGQGKAINIGLAGLGQMGRGLLSQIRGLPGMEIIVLADRDTENTVDNLKDLGIGEDDYLFLGSGDMVKEHKRAGGLEVAVDNFSRKAVSRMSQALREHRLVYSESLSPLFTLREVEVVIDATGSPEAGAYIALNTLSSGKHLITLNVEMDVTIGPFLRDLAHENGVIYSLSAGDEPPAAKELYDFASILGMDVVAAGKGKNNPLDRQADPESLAAYAASKGSNPYMMTSFVDGTKSMVEMACLSNATGLVPDCRGMHAVRSDIDQLLEKLRPVDQGGILNRTGVVEFVIGDLAPGVFCIYTTENRLIREELKYLLLGDGPNYLLYRPYHLTSLETPISVARAYLEKEPTMIPRGDLISEVITLAKRDLGAGEEIDRIGGYKVYGLIESIDTARDEGLLPIGLSQGAVLKRAVEKNSPITYNDVDLAPGSLIGRIRKIQDGQEQQPESL